MTETEPAVTMTDAAAAAIAQHLVGHSQAIRIIAIDRAIRAGATANAALLVEEAARIEKYIRGA